MTTDTLTFRAADTADIPELCRLRLAYLTEDLGEMTPGMRTQISQQLPLYFAAHLGRDCFVNAAALPDGTLAGNVILCCTEKPANPFFPSGKSGTVLGVYTVPQYRGCGIATKLMQMLIADARAQQLDRIVLGATKMGRPVYEKLGFVPQHSAYTDMVLTLHDASSL